MTTEPVPNWKENFPISWADDHYVTRREFTKSLALVSCAAFASNAALVGLGALEDQKRMEESDPRMIARVDELSVGGSKVFDFPEEGDQCLLVRLEEDKFSAFTQKCTHLGCPVFYQEEPRRLACPCHNGAFDAGTGEVLYGPPPRRLPKVTLERKGEELWATGIQF